MSDQGVVRGTRRRSNSELVFNDSDLSNTRNNLSHQSQQIISVDFPEDYIESPMWVGTGTRLQARKLPVNCDQEIVISTKLDNFRLKFRIDRQPLTMSRSLLMDLILTIVY